MAPKEDDSTKLFRKDFLREKGKEELPSSFVSFKGTSDFYGDPSLNELLDIRWQQSVEEIRNAASIWQMVGISRQSCRDSAEREHFRRRFTLSSKRPVVIGIKRRN